MVQKILVFAAGLLIIGSSLFAQDILIDTDGNLTTGTSNSDGNLKVVGASGEHGIVGETAGTGAAGVIGINTDSNSYGAIGSDQYGVYGNSSSGYAGYFQGNVSISGNLDVGSLTGETDPTVNAGVKDGVDWTEISGIPTGFADGIDDTGNAGIWNSSGSDIYFNSGKVGIGTSAPSGKLDVNGDICLGGICRTTWPSGSGTGAFTDTGISAYYNGGDVGIGTSSPQGLLNADSRVLHMVKPPASAGDTAVGIRLEIENTVDAGIFSGYRAGGSGGLFVGTLSDHRVGLGTNGTEQVILETNGALTTKGDVGIGTSSPLQPLHVEGNAYISGKLGIGIDSPANNLQVSGGSALFSSDSGDFRLSVSKKLGPDIASIIFQDSFSPRAELGLTYDDNFHIKVSPDGTTLTDALIIDNTNGNVAIGTSDTAYKLHVIAANNSAVWAESTSALPTLNVLQYGTGYGTRIVHNGSSGAALFIRHSGGGELLLLRNNTSEVMRVDNAGNVGIGTASPKSALQVNGYTQLALTSGAPPSADCDDASERGRMKVDNVAGLLYICVDSGWAAK